MSQIFIFEFDMKYVEWSDKYLSNDEMGMRIDGGWSLQGPIFKNKFSGGDAKSHYWRKELDHFSDCSAKKVFDLVASNSHLVGNFSWTDDSHPKMKLKDLFLWEENPEFPKVSIKGFEEKFPAPSWMGGKREVVHEFIGAWWTAGSLNRDESAEIYLADSEVKFWLPNPSYECWRDQGILLPDPLPEDKHFYAFWE